MRHGPIRLWMTSCHNVTGLDINEKDVNLAVFHNPLVDLPVPITVQRGTIDKILCNCGV